MSRETIKIDGLRELEVAFREIAPKIKGNPLRTAARAMTVPIIESAKNRVHQNPETKTSLANAMDKRLIPVSERDAATAKGDSIEVFEVGPRKKKKKGVLPGWYAHFVEFGIPGGRQGAQPARPFLRPAFEDTKHEQIEEFVKKFSKTLDLAAKRLAKLAK